MLVALDTALDRRGLPHAEHLENMERNPSVARDLDDHLDDQHAYATPRSLHAQRNRSVASHDLYDQRAYVTPRSLHAPRNHGVHDDHLDDQRAYVTPGSLHETESAPKLPPRHASKVLPRADGYLDVEPKTE